jgi:hypothetical protein
MYGAMIETFPAPILPRATAAPHRRSMGLRIVRLVGMRTERLLLIAMRDRQSLSPPAQAFVELVERRRVERR